MFGIVVTGIYVCRFVGVVIFVIAVTAVFGLIVVVVVGVLSDHIFAIDFATNS